MPLTPSFSEPLKYALERLGLQELELSPDHAVHNIWYLDILNNLGMNHQCHRWADLQNHNSSSI